MPYHAIDDPAKLRRVLEATLLLETNLDLSTVLRRVIDEARSMTGARYGALGVLNEDRTALAEFLTVGLEQDEEQRIGARPTGKGVLGLLIADPKPVRMATIDAHPESYGFPPGHPPMTSFLGVPIKVRDEVYGNLYLTDKIGWSEFTHDDEALVAALAIGAGLAIENARLHERVRSVAVLEDRDRLARDLHDTVIQRLFAIGLALQSTAGAVTNDDVRSRLTMAISEIDETIRQIRTTIFELGSAEGDQGVRAAILGLVRELTPVVGFEVQVEFEGPVDTAVSDEVREHLLATIREAVTNIGRHAHATQARLQLDITPGQCRLVIVDDGRGLGGADARPGGLGLVNLRRRAEKLQGTFVVESPPAGGTSLSWQVPVNH